ncbi:[NiFe]-hydrogenase assembly chaperone HybE [Sedimenticola thiotaurini]|uniref:[NiFe]-hydrogenase assembly chaperone HybE n=1 Tax=Sedimenticola thiotaurini TaxID=1543721 RepID=UPI00069CAFAB|nr:[NiFe]-hydrogenase assembly chaperone HybE [Sedimenticola thiotaurini]
MTCPAFFTTAPADQITQAFRQIEQNQMRGLPVCNAKLTTEVVGLRRFDQYWLGVLITPWTLQLILLPATDRAENLPEGACRTMQFPQGEIVFMASDNPDLGTYLACSLMSPLHDYPSQAVIRNTAEEVMSLLFQSAETQPQGESVKVAMPGRLDVEREAKTGEKKTATRREFLRGMMG